jgi:hypothetical protein
MDEKSTNDQKQVKLDEYDNISLWQLLPSGNGKGLKKLKEIVNSELNSHPQRSMDKPLSVLISGQSGKRTHAFSTLKALGYEYIKHSPAALLANMNDLVEFFQGSTPETAYVISDLHSINTGVLKKFYQILNEGNLIAHNHITHQKTLFPVLGPVAMTIRDQNKIPIYLKESFTYSVSLGEYTAQQKELITLQRLKYAGIEIQDEQVLKTLLLHCHSELNGLIQLLDLSITVMLGDGRDVLTSGDVRKGKELF